MNKIFLSMLAAAFFFGFFYVDITTIVLFPTVPIIPFRLSH
jgi:hypothetical protein